MLRYRYFHRLLAIAICVFIYCLIMIFKLKVSGKTAQQQQAIFSYYKRQCARKILRLVKAQCQVTTQVPFKRQHNRIYIYVSNHASYLDPPLAQALLPGTIRYVATEYLFHVPIFGSLLKQSGTISIKDKDFEQQSKRLLQSEIDLWVYPEGRRSRDGRLMPFLMTAFRIAREMQAVIIPVAIKGTHKALAAGKLQLNINQTLELCIGKPIDTLDYSRPEQQIQLRVDVRAAIVQLLLSK